MKWDKATSEKSKEVDTESAYAELGKHVHGFLSNIDADVVIGLADGGYGIYKLYHNETGDKLKLLADSSKLSVVLKKASKILNCVHSFEGDTGWCKLCNVHKTVVE